MQIPSPDNIYAHRAGAPVWRPYKSGLQTTPPNNIYANGTGAPVWRPYDLTVIPSSIPLYRCVLSDVIDLPKHNKQCFLIQYQ